MLPPLPIRERFSTCPVLTFSPANSMTPLREVRASQWSLARLGKRTSSNGRVSGINIKIRHRHPAPRDYGPTKPHGKTMADFQRSNVDAERGICHNTTQMHHCILSASTPAMAGAESPRSSRGATNRHPLAGFSARQLSYIAPIAKRVRMPMQSSAQ